MPKFKVRAPDGQEFNVNGPEGSTIEDAYAYVEANLWTPKGPAPEPKTGFIPSVIRGGKQLSGLVGDVLPAMVGKAIGKDEYAAKQMEEYAATQKEIQEKYPSRVPSYKDIKSVGDAIDYAVESVGELVPSMLPSLITGGVGGIAARGLSAGAQAAAKEAARKELMKDSVQAAIKSGAYGGQKETLAAINTIAKEAGGKAAAEIAAKATVRGQIAGAALSSGAQNIPEVYQNVYEAVDGNVGGKELATALAFGTFNTALDTVLPASLLKKITGVGLPKEAVAAAWYKRLAKGGVKGFAQEGATETVQEASSAAAEKFVNENKNFFTEENFERFINAGLKGGLGGGTATGVTDVLTGKGPQKQKKASEAAKEIVDEIKTKEEIADVAEEVSKKETITATSLDELKKKAANIGKKIEESENLDEATKNELNEELDASLKGEPPKAPKLDTSDLTKEAQDLIAVAETGGIPQKSDKQLKAIAKQNGVTFNPTIDTVEDLIAQLKAKLGEADARQRDLTASGESTEVSGERRAEDTGGVEASDGLGVDGDEGVVVTDKDTAGDEQSALEFQRWLEANDIRLTDIESDAQFAELQARFEQERGSKEVIKAPPVEEAVAEEVEAKPSQVELAAQAAEEDQVEEKKGPISRTGQEAMKQGQAYRQQQAAIAAEINADNTLTAEEKATAKAFNNYMVVANNNIKRALDLLAADLYAGAANNPYMPNTGGVNAKNFYAGLNPTNKKIVDERVAFLKAQENRINSLAEKAEAREADKAAETEGDENALLRRVQMFGHTTPSLIRAVFLGDTRAALQEIAQGKGFNQLDRMIAKRILDSKTFPEIEIVPAETLVDADGRQASGQYVTQTDTAQIADGEVDSHSVLHEVTHGYLHALIREFQANNIVNKGLTQLNDLYTYLRDNHPELAGQYGMGDLSEFASEVMSNPEFQIQLAQIPYQRVNAFTAFAQAVLRVMGISPNDKATALAAGLIAIDKSLATGRLYQDNEVTGKIAMPPPKVIREGEEADVEGLEGVAAGTKKLPREKQTYAQAKEGLRKDVESKEGAPQVKKLFTTRDGWNWWVRKFQNSREVLKRIQKAMGRNGVLISQGAKRNDVAAQFDLSSALAETNYNEYLMPIYKDINEMAAEYAKLSGQSFEEAMAELHLYAELKHEPERRHILYLLNVPLKDEAAAIRKEILAGVSALKGTEQERQATAQQYRQLLEDVVADKANLKDPLSNENQDRYNVIADRSAQEVAEIRAAQLANPQVSKHIELLDGIMGKLQEVNVATAELNKIGHYWSSPVDNIVKFYGYKNYVPFKGRPDQATVNDFADPFSKRLAGDLSEGQDATQGRVTEAENIVLRTMAEGVKASLRAGRKDLALSIKNAVNQGFLKGEVNPAKLTGEKGKPVSFADRYILGKSIKELKSATTVFNYNDDGTIDVIALTDPEQREAIRRTFKESHPFVDMLNSFTSGMGQMHTRYNPSFGPINFAGDVLTNAFTMGVELGPKATFDLIKTVAAQVGRGGLFKAGKVAHLYNQGRLKELDKYTDPKSKDYDPFYENLVEYLERGGKVSYIQGFATKSQTDLARAEMKRAGKTVTKADIDKVVDVWTDAFELASRAGAYKVAKEKYLQENVGKKDMSQAEMLEDAKSRATYYAKNLANFEQVGEYGKTLGALYMFARPAATGAVRAIEALQPLMVKIANKFNAGIPLSAEEEQQARNAQKMLIGLAGMGYAAWVMSYMMADDDELDRNRTAVDDMDRWVRYMRFPLPKWLTGEDKEIIMQTRWGFGLGAFASAGAQVAGMVHGSSSLGKGLENIMEAGLDSFLPLPISRISVLENPAAWFMDSATPSAFRPFMEYVMNVDSLGREIYNNRQSRAGNAYTGGDNIPEGYKSAARMLFDVTQGGIDVSPNTLYFFASNYVDGAAKLGNGAYNLGLVATGEKAFNPKTDTILFDSFFGSPSNIDSREFSEMEKEIKALEIRLKTLEKDPENYAKFLENNPEAPFMVNYYNQAVNGGLKDLRAMANIVRSSRDFSPKERSETVRDIVRMQNLVKRGILNNFEAMKEN
jgi:hypothetical protein